MKFKIKEKIYFKTFGCRTNIYDTELLKSYVKDYQITNDESQADIIVINSCTVTNNADSSVRAYINQARRTNSLGDDLKFVLTGCGAVSKGRDLFSKKEVFAVLGASNKDKINELLKSQQEFFELGDLNFVDKKIVVSYENHTKAFVKIQEGCNFSCSYCIIPSVRGESRSCSMKDIVEQIKLLAQNGYNEVVLTGTNIGSYGKEFGSSLGKLLQEIGKIAGIKRVRLGSIEPVQIDESFCEVLDEPWLERHLHIALQHSSERMLRLMRRRNEAFKDLELFLMLKDKGFALGTDFVVGHPGESEEIWQEAVINFKNFPLTHLHAFAYSKRDGTHAITLCKELGEVPGNIAKARIAELKDIVRDNNLRFREEKKSEELNILVEQKKGDFYYGYDQFYNLAEIKSARDITKEWLSANNYEACLDLNKIKLENA